MHLKTTDKTEDANAMPVEILESRSVRLPQSKLLMKALLSLRRLPEVSSVSLLEQSYLVDKKKNWLSRPVRGEVNLVILQKYLPLH
jgi:hypothetical protein